LKRIFVTGAPGSKWSSVVKNIYFSDSIDRSDHAEHRTYQDSLHIGSYFDPGMEFGRWFDRLDRHSKQECETEFDLPFSGTGTRIVKSHVFANHIDFLKEIWPNTPIVLVQRSTDACLGWWVRCGGFDITYPDYKEYYQNLQRMGEEIQKQNNSIGAAWNKYPGSTVFDNQDLAAVLELSFPLHTSIHDYRDHDIRVKVI
jgi:hypothetical protein